MKSIKDGLVVNLRMIRHIILMALTYHVNVAVCSFPCEFLYGGCKHNLEILPPVLSLPLKLAHASAHRNPHAYVPSLPGKLPHCAKPGLTFCEKIDKYPSDLIRTLAVKAHFNLKTLYIDESRGNSDRSQKNRPYGPPPNTYGPPSNTYGPPPNTYGPPPNTSPNTAPHTSDHSSSHGTSGHQYSTPATHVHVHLNNVQVFNQSSQSSGYPDRQYPLDESLTHLVDPALYASFSDFSTYNPNEWWKRSERSSGQTSSQRKRRQTPPTSGTELCPTRSQFIMPRAALNNRGEWKYVVNIDQGSQKYTQLVRSETCLTTECNGICSIPNGYTSRCQQKYVQKRLVALEGTGSNLYTDVFWFPHCCVCQIAPDIR